MYDTIGVFAPLVSFFNILLLVLSSGLHRTISPSSEKSQTGRETAAVATQRSTRGAAYRTGGLLRGAARTRSQGKSRYGLLYIHTTHNVGKHTIYHPSHVHSVVSFFSFRDSILIFV